MPKVFVTDAEQGRIPLSLVRSLGRKGIKIHVGGDMKIATSYYSAYCTKKVVYPSILLKPIQFKNFMFNYIKKEKFDVVFPLLNELVLFFSKYKKELSRFTSVPLVDYDKMILALDKANTLKIAESIKIPHPKTYYPDNLFELKQVISDLVYPVVVKARRNYGAVGVELCHKKERLKQAYTNISKIYGSPIVQEYIPDGGDAIGVSCLFGYKNDVKAAFVHRRLRQYPIRGGPSTLRESIRHSKAESIAIKLLKKINWFGVAMVEFKIDPRDNKPKLMEINPRFWGSLSLPIFAGVDFPYLLYKLVTEGNVEKVRKYPLGIKSRWVGGDFLYLLHTKNKLKFLKEFLNFNQKDTYLEDIAKDDPLPMFSRPLSLIYLLNRKTRNRIFR
jgi:predicted ATP-grasp superfamily ATP-dependent carboligase|tara:strand:+ start:711 stop:1874 length:1164 start_codon:yes stop_codon:yes gene_type:complete